MHINIIIEKHGNALKSTQLETAHNQTHQGMFLHLKGYYTSYYYSIIVITRLLIRFDKGDVKTNASDSRMLTTLQQFYMNETYV